MRRHRPRLQHSDRRALERAGWRTLLDYRENHVRGDDGTLIDVAPCWTAEAELLHGAVTISVASATAPTVDEAWARVRRAVQV